MSGKFGKSLFPQKRELQSQQKNVNVKAEHITAVGPVKQKQTNKKIQSDIEQSDHSWHLALLVRKREIRVKLPISVFTPFKCM